MNAAGINQHTGKTHCKRGHEFTPDNTYIYDYSKRDYDIPYKTPRRACKTCIKAQANKYNALKRKKSTLSLTPP